MKKLFLLGAILIPFFGLSQMRVIRDTLFINDNTKLIKGQYLNFGTGSNSETKEFNYITLRFNGEKLGTAWNGLKLPIKDFKIYNSKKTGEKIYVILTKGLSGFMCDIEPAISSREVIIKGLNDNVTNQGNTSPVSVADEIMKLKKLKDDGVLTEDEFQSQKKKLLNK